MRLQEAKIKEAIPHPEKLVRREALRYFADCFSRDVEVMPLAIKAIESYGRGHAFPHVHVLTNLAQTEATVSATSTTDAAPAATSSATAASVTTTMVSNGPVPDTAENRAKYGQPLSRAGKRTAARGN